MNVFRVVRVILYGIGVISVLGLVGFLILNEYLVHQEQPQARGPYLQSVTPTSVWVVWETTQPIRGRVEYGRSRELGQMVEERIPTLHHEVQLQDLDPYTDYYYRVAGEIFSFRTAADSKQLNFTFTVFGDTRSGHSIHKRIIKQMVALEPDFVIHTGDLVESGRFDSEWNRFFKIEAPLLGIAPFFPTIGNHEDYIPGNPNHPYLKLFHLPGNEIWYTFDYGHARFICLQIDGNPREGSLPNEEQLAWLEDELAANKASWLIVYFHVGVFTSRSEDVLETENREKLLPLFTEYGVDLVFMGHHHSYERILVNGITFIVTAGGGASLYEFTEPESGSQAAIQAHHFVEIEIDGAQLIGRVIDHQGRMIDSFSLSSKK